MEKILKGELFAVELKEAIRADVAACQKKKIHPTMCVVQLMNDPSFAVYQAAQKKCARYLGIQYITEDFAGDSAREQQRKIRKLSNNKRIHGIVVQMPISDPDHFQRILGSIDPAKDIEGVTPYNQGQLFSSSRGFVSPTALAAFRMASSGSGSLKGKEAVIVGHSALVGKPLAMLFLQAFATVTVCHIGTFEREHLVEHIQRAEILCVAVGKPRLIRGEWIRKGSIVIDIGISRTPEGLSGDVEFDKALERAGAITPVPGGVGPFTTAVLYENLMKAVHIQQGAPR